MKSYAFEDVLRHASLCTANLDQWEDNLYLGLLPRAGWPLGASGTPAKAVMSRGRLTRRSSRSPYRSPEGRGDSRVVITRHQAPMVNVRSFSLRAGYCGGAEINQTGYSRDNDDVTHQRIC